MRILVLLAALLPGACCLAQSIQNVKASYANSKVTVVYDIAGASQNQQFNLDLYASHDNFLKPLRNVSGDVGKNIAGGVAKQIEWDIAAELGEFTGQITFRIKGDPVPIAWAFKNPTTGGFVRRGKSSAVQWEGGLKDQTVRLELFKDSARVASLGEVKNSGQHAWDVPKDLDKGVYSLKLTSGTESAQSVPFQVKAKIPLYLKIIPFAVVGAIIVFWPEDPPPPPPPSQDLPGAPGPK